MALDFLLYFQVSTDQQSIVNILQLSGGQWEPAETETNQSSIFISHCQTGSECSPVIENQQEVSVNQSRRWDDVWICGRPKQMYRECSRVDSHG